MTPDTVGNDVIVTLIYKLSLDDGTTVEFSDDADPLVYLHGHENIIPGLENALTGLKVGDQKSILVEPEDGYGDYDDEDIEEVPLTEMPPDFKPEVGMLLEVHDEEMGDQLAMISEIAADHLLLDFNHPMAGKRLHFDVTIKGLRAATPEELDHGHVHDGGHHH